MVHFTTAAIEDQYLSVILTLLAAYLGKERGESIVIVHRPSVEGMIVALGALGAYPHENLSHILGHLQAVLLDLIKVRRWILECSTGGCEQLSDDLIQRRIRSDLIDKPVVIEVSSLVTDLIVALDHQEVGPLHRPDLAELLATQKRLDQRSSLVRIGIGQKPYGLLLSRKQSSDIHCSPTHKLLVGAKPTGRQPQLQEFRIDQCIDVTSLTRLVLILHSSGQSQDLGSYRVRIEPRHHESFATHAAGDRAVGIDRAGPLVVGRKACKIPNVSLSPIGISRYCDDSLLGSLALKDRLRWIHIHLGHRRWPCSIRQSTGLKPCQYRLVMLAAGLDFLAPRMLDRSGCLEKQQTLVGYGQVDAANPDFTGDPLIIPKRIESE